MMFARDIHVFQVRFGEEKEFVLMSGTDISDCKWFLATKYAGTCLAEYLARANNARPTRRLTFVRRRSHLHSVGLTETHLLYSMSIILY